MKLKTLLTCAFLITTGSATKLSRFDENDEDGDFLRLAKNVFNLVTTIDSFERKKTSIIVRFK